jgi:hypothetical protein
MVSGYYRNHSALQPKSPYHPSMPLDLTRNAVPEIPYNAAIWKVDPQPARSTLTNGTARIENPPDGY